MENIINSIMNFLIEAKNVFVIQFSTFGIMDAIDIFVVAYIFYKALGFVKETRAAQLLKGIILILVLMQISSMLKMFTVNFILVNTVQLGLIAVLIIFQPELRSALERVGRSKLGSKLFMQDEAAISRDLKNSVSATCNACEYLSKNKIGALIVFERLTKLGEIIKTGTKVEADLTGELLVSIFFPNSPLHDGAAIIREGKIYAAGCFLPLSQKGELSRSLGTRHRAAIGVNENSDALVIVVSEESGIISTVDGGEIIRGYSIETLRDFLGKALAPPSLPSAGKTKPHKKEASK